MRTTFPAPAPRRCARRHLRPVAARSEPVARDRSSSTATVRVVFATLLLAPTPAWALPGPEMVVPALLGTVQAAILLTALLRELVPRRVRRGLLVLLVLSLAIAIHPVAPLLVAWPLLAGRRTLLALGLLVGLGVVGLALTRFDPPPPPLPRASGAPPVVHLGEQEDFSHCRVDSAPLVRAPDLADIEVHPTTVFVVGPSGPPPGVLPEAAAVLDIRELATDSNCYSPKLRSWMQPLVKPWIAGRGLDAPPRIHTVALRARDRVWVPDAALVAAHEILTAPTREHARYAGQTVIVLSNSALRSRLAAVRLLEEAGATVVGITGEREAPGPRRPAATLFALSFAVAYFALVWCDRRLFAWRAARAARARNDTALALGLGWAAALLPVGAAGAALVALVPLPPALLTLVTPPAWGAHAVPAATAGLAVAAIGWIVVARSGPPRAWVPLGYIGAAAALACLFAQLGGSLHALHLLGAGFTWLGIGALRLALPDRRRLEHARDAGGKIAGLASLVREGVRVPPGLALRSATDPAIRQQLGDVPLLVRSSAPDEDGADASAAGRYPSVATDLAGVAGAIEAVQASYPAAGAVLVMPRIPAARSGVVQVVPERGLALLEEGEGTDAVTAGRVVRRRALDLKRAYLPEALGRAAAVRDDAYVEYLRGDVTWIVQRRPAPAPFELDAAALAELEALDLPSREGPLPVLRRLDSDGLPERCAPQTLALWAGHWSRHGALGRALPLPRWLLPRRVVVAAWGALWSVEPARRQLEALLAIRGRFPGLCEALLRPLHSEPGDLDELAAFALALRFARPLLPEGEPQPTRGSEFARALRAGDLTGFGHRAPHDLDPASPRFGPIGARPSLPAVPAAWTRAHADAWRDAIRDRMAWEVAQLPPGTPYTGHQPALRVLTAEELPSAALPGLDAEASTGLWVSGEGPIAGVLTRDPHAAGPGRILHLRQPTPAAAAHFAGFAAVVAETGGALSHAALVAREDAVPALFGATVPDGAERVELTREGNVVARES